MYRKKIALLQIGVQLFTSLLPLCSLAVNAEASENRQTLSDENIAAKATELGSTFGTSDSHSSLMGWGAQQALSAGTAEINAWLNQFGTARINVSVNEDFSLEGTEFDVLLPVYETNDHLFFSQLGYRRIDDRNTANLGLGHRIFLNEKMLGYNLFYDRQMSGVQHERIGLGGEFAVDNLKLAANSYFRLTGWQDSKQFEDYSERAANGFDLRAEGYLPAWPQLGATLKYEQYYGDNVALFGDDERQKDPYAVTTGLNYTPIPLVTFGTEYKMGKSGRNDMQANVSFSWNFNDSWNKQTSAENVAFKRSLQGSRHDLVERNNSIVLDYRKQQVISLTLPADISGDEKSVIAINAVVKSKHPVESIDWQANELRAAGGEILPQTNGSYQIRLPAYQPNQPNVYPVTARALDDRGNQSNVSHTRVTVNAATLNLTLAQDLTQGIADGKQAVSYTATLLDANNKPAANVPVEWRNAGLDVTMSDAKMRTNAQGQALMKLTSTHSGTVTVSALAEGQEKAARPVVFTADASSARFSDLLVDKNQALANAKDSVIVSTFVSDASGNPLSDVNVSWKSSSADVLLSASESKTDAAGKANVTATSASVTTATVSASTTTLNATSPEIRFVANLDAITLGDISTSKTQATASGQDAIIFTTVVTDDSGHPLPDVMVNWTGPSTDLTLSVPQSLTDTRGQAQVSGTSLKAGSYALTAEVRGQKKTSKPVAYTASADTLKIDTVTADKTQAVASGKDAITYTVKVTDAQSNPLEGITVEWSASDSGAQLSAAQSVTNGNGEATTQVTAIKSINTVITATANGQSKAAAQAGFIADESTANITSLTVSKTTVLSNGSDSAIFTAEVKDAHDNILTGADVNWTTTLNTLSAATSKTDSSGKATVSLSGTNAGTPTVTAEISGADKSLNTVRFINEVSAEWNISGNGSSYNTGEIKGYPSLGFVAVAPTDGPRALVWDGPLGQKTPLTVPAKDQDGNNVNITLKGTRQSGCTERTFNSAVACADASSGMWAKLFYFDADNTQLPPGTYTGVINFMGKDWNDSNFAFSYAVSFTLVKH
jgi:adhesin/invasin